MTNEIQVSELEMVDAVAAIAERIEVSGEYTARFADTNVLQTVVPVKNQVIYGRRGTGKTHLLGRLKEHYGERYAELKVLPVFVDGREIAYRSPETETNPVIAVLITYRRFLDAVVEAISEFVQDTIVLSALQKMWPAGTDKTRLKTIHSLLSELQQIVRFGEVEMTHGKATTEVEQSKSKESAKYLAVDLKLAADVKKLAESNASFGVGYEKASTSSAGERLKIVYEGLTTINHAKIREDIERIIELIDADTLVVLFDEWSAVDLADQPLLAEMLRATLLGGKRFGMKFACIPFLTRLSETDEQGQAIGLPIGEEVFVDVNLDRLCNAYTNPTEVTRFLLAVLQKHLGATLPQLQKVSEDDWFSYCIDRVFSGDTTIAELVKASAGVPRDFLRIFCRSFRAAQEALPLTEHIVRGAAHDFFQNEKKILVDDRHRARALYDDIFNGICLPAQSYVFFVSSKFGKSSLLEELWHHRLVHLLFQGHFAHANETPGTFDIYVMDYGRYVSMRSSKKGEEFYHKAEAFLHFFTDTFFYLKPILRFTEMDDAIKSRLAKHFAQTLETVSPRIDESLEDCSALLADDLILKHESGT